MNSDQSPLNYRPYSRNQGTRRSRSASGASTGCKNTETTESMRLERLLHEFGELCVFDANAYGRVGASAFLPPQIINMGSSALSEYEFPAKSRSRKIRDCDVDFDKVGRSP